MESRFERDTFRDVLVMGGLSDAKERPIELDLQLFDNDGSCFAMNVMTLNRYEDVIRENLDVGYDKDAAKIFVINEEFLALDALSELLTSTDRHIFDHFVQKVEIDNE